MATILPHSAGAGPSTVSDLLAARARLAPDAIALEAPDLEALSFTDWQAEVSRLAQALSESGLAPGRRAALVMGNGSATASLILALLDCASLVPFNPDYRQTEFDRFFARIGIEVLLTDTAAGHACRQAAGRAGLPVIDVIPDTARAGIAALQLPSAGLPLRDSAPGTDPPPLILHTSGSTAEPKIVPLSQANLLASAANLVTSLALGNDDRGLAMMPMFHIGAIVDLLLAPIAAGASLVVPSAAGGDSFCRCLREFEPSWYQGVPTMLRDIVNRVQADPDRLAGTRPLRLVRSVSSALPNRLLHEVESRLQTVVIEIYGMTETAGVICSNPLPPAQQKPGSVGLPQGCELRIVDLRGNPLPIGERGEVVVRGASVMHAYEDRERGREKDFFGDFFRTGDEGYFDADGYLYLCGRLREIINRGGEKISPLEIDRVAERHPSVRAAASFALRHPSLGEEVGLAVVAADSANFDEAALLDYLREHLSAHKLPRQVSLVERLPRAAGGKLQRHRIADQVAAAHGNRSRQTWEAPGTELGRYIAELWQRGLDVERVGRHDNFFDLGGDSLSAAAIVGELMHRFPAMHPSALYDYPTLLQLERHLDEMPGQPTLAAAPEPELGDIGSVLARFMGVWAGERLERESLVVGRNVDGQRTPLFWCVNGYAEYDALARQMDPQQPVYGMRSLYDTGYKSDAATRRLAQLYTDEIRALQPRGPYLVGGFCEGGKIGFQIAERLRADNEIVASLLLHEQFVASPYGGRVAIFVCRPGRNNPYYNFRDATRGWRKFYSGELQLYETNGRHKDCYESPDIEIVARQIQREMKRALGYRHDDTLDRRNRLQRLPLDAYRARVEFDAPKRVLAGSRFNVDVKITNQSAFEWRATRDSGVLLGAKWLRKSGETRVWMAGSSDLPRALQPGETISMPLAIRAPLRLKPMYLELDLVDDGVSWFSELGSPSSRHLVEVSLLPF